MGCSGLCVPRGDHTGTEGCEKCVTRCRWTVTKKLGCSERCRSGETIPALARCGRPGERGVGGALTTKTVRIDIGAVPRG